MEPIETIHMQSGCTINICIDAILPPEEAKKAWDRAQKIVMEDQWRKQLQKRREENGNVFTT